MNTNTTHRRIGAALIACVMTACGGGSDKLEPAPAPTGPVPEICGLNLAFATWGGCEPRPTVPTPAPCPVDLSPMNVVICPKP